MHVSYEEPGHTDPFDGNQMPALVRLIKTPSTIVKTDFTTSDKSSPVSGLELGAAENMRKINLWTGNRHRRPARIL